MKWARSPTPRCGLLLCLMLAAVAAQAACSKQRKASVRVQLPDGAGTVVQFVPTSALAEVVELNSGGAELALTLANYETSCERFVVPGPGQLLVSVVITTPKKGDLTANRSFAWAGQEAHGGTPLVPEHAYARPELRLGRRGYSPAPGGWIKLTDASIEEHGWIAGLLNFAYAGDAAHPASSVQGSFVARLCRADVSAPPVAGP